MEIRSPAWRNFTQNLPPPSFVHYSLGWYQKCHPSRTLVRGTRPKHLVLNSGVANSIWLVFQAQIQDFDFDQGDPKTGSDTSHSGGFWTPFCGPHATCAPFCLKLSMELLWVQTVDSWPLPPLHQSLSSVQDTVGRERLYQRELPSTFMSSGVQAETEAQLRGHWEYKWNCSGSRVTCHTHPGVVLFHLAWTKRAWYYFGQPLCDQMLFSPRSMCTICLKWVLDPRTPRSVLWLLVGILTHGCGFLFLHCVTVCVWHSFPNSCCGKLCLALAPSDSCFCTLCSLS